MTTITQDPLTRKARNSDGSSLRAVPPQSKAEHKAVCSIDGEPWPCRYEQREGNFRIAQYHSVFCSACGKQRNAWASLDVEADLSGHRVYFHARKRCSLKATEWWDANIKPHTGEDLFVTMLNGVTIGGRSIGDLTRYLGIKAKPKLVGE